jgi:CubicO group peptidase (beta-lactamase class C family)
VAEGLTGLEPGDEPMDPGTIMRIASITKPITAAAALQLVDDGLLAVDSPVDEWLPELKDAVVVRTPGSPLADVVPLERMITVHDLLTSRSGWGFPSDFRRPAVQALFAVQTDGRYPHAYPPADTWLTRLAGVPLAAQPGATWSYDTSLTILGILIERVSGQRLGERLAERLFEPLGMTDTGFTVRPVDMHRFARLYTAGDGALLEADDRGAWSTSPALELGNGGLVGTAGDWWRFARMLLAAGEGPHGRVLSEGLVQRMLSNHLSEAQRSDARMFLEGQGWGFGGAVDVDARDPWAVPGRYGWVGGTGTSGHLVPSTGETTILLTQVCASEPGLMPIYRDVWTAAA